MSFRTNQWAQFVKTQCTEMRPFIPGESLEGVKVSAEDRLFIKNEVPLSLEKEDLKPNYGMIARDPWNHKDMWYINPYRFRQTYVSESGLNKALSEAE